MRSKHLSRYLFIKYAFSLQLYSSIFAYSVCHGAAPVAELASPQEPLRQTSETQLFTGPDDSTPVLEAIQKGEVLSPMAETVGTGGTRWYLVLSKSGAIGWIKADNSDESKKLEAFFKSLPNEPTVFNPIDRASPPSNTRSQREITIPVDIRGSKVIVPVTFNRSVTASLEVDTGAGRTMISRGIARDLRLYSLASRTVSGITGSAIASVSRIESVKLGDAEVRNLLVDIHDLPGDRRYEGLLGMDFLHNFQMSLDTRKRLLVLTPR